MSLEEHKCEACEGGVKPLGSDKAEELLKEVGGWKLIDNRISRNFEFPDFKSALGFVNKVGEIAEEESHHPDISLGWGRAEISLTTHSIGGLSKNDFILASKIDRLNTQ